MAITFGENDYRLGGLERLLEANILLQRDHFAGSAYLAGRAVECMLRAVIWRNDPDYRTGRKSLETGHDLRELLVLVLNLGVVKDLSERDELGGLVQRIGRLWYNNLRFASTEKLRGRWWELGEIDKR